MPYLAHAAMQIALSSGDTPPEWIQLFPLGRVGAKDGRGPWVIDDPQAIIEASQADQRPLPIDYDHAIDLGAKSGQPGIAAGWIVELQARDTGIWGRVEWTEKGGATITAKEYRFVSPTFTLDDKKTHVARIMRAALTNNPAIQELPALARSQSEEDPVDLEQFLAALAKALGVENPTTESMLTAVTAMASDRSAVRAAIVASALSVEDGFEPDEIGAAVTAVCQAPADATAAAAIQGLQTEVNALKANAAKEKAEAAVAAAMKDGKIAPATREHFLTMATNDPDGFAAFVKAQPVIVQPGTTAATDPPPADGSLTELELATCRATGISVEDFKKARKAEIEKGIF